MSPYEIGVLLHYYYSAVDHPDMERGPPIWRPMIEAFKEREVLEDAPEPGKVVYRLTKRGHAYVAALCALPLPLPVLVQTWEMPK